MRISRVSEPVPRVSWLPRQTASAFSSESVEMLTFPPRLASGAAEVVQKSTPFGSADPTRQHVR